jgi:hypothetical protein
MNGPAWENLDDFLSGDDFAVQAIITPLNGAPRPPVSVLFDEPYLNAQTGEYEMDTSDPRISGKESDFAGIGRGAVVQIGAASYDVMTDPQGDGTGWAVLKLAPQ